MQIINELRNYIKTNYVQKGFKSKYMNLDIDQYRIINGYGFFPYGNGLLDKFPFNQNKGIMVLGQDFGTEAYIKDANKNIKHIGEVNSISLNNTLKILSAHLDDGIFLTNLFIGLRIKEPMTGINPELKNNEENYLTGCNKIFMHQIETIQPRKIIVLGKEPYNFICKINEQYDFIIKSFYSYFEYVENNLYGFKISDVPVLCIPHPSFWHANVSNSKSSDYAKTHKRSNEEWIALIDKFVNN
jgi:uracil-DNA glycosylase